MYRVLNKFKKGEDVEWGRRGRKPYVPDDVLLLHVSAHLDNTESEAITKKDVAKIIETTCKSACESRGESIITLSSPTTKNKKELQLIY